MSRSACSKETKEEEEEEEEVEVASGPTFGTAWQK